MRVLLSIFTATALASTEQDEETGLLQHRLSVGEGAKTDLESELDVDCKSGPKNCVKTTTTPPDNGRVTVTLPPRPTRKPRTTTTDAPPKTAAPTTTTTTAAPTTTTTTAAPTTTTTTAAPTTTTTTAAPTTRTTTARTTVGSSAQFEECRVWGDPQVTSFDRLVSARFQCNGRYYDDSTIDSYKDGDYYLLKSSEIEVQGRFGSGMGTTRSMGREAAVKVGDDVIRVRPDAIFLNEDKVGEGLNGGLSDGNEFAGKFRVVKWGGGVVIMHEEVDSVKVWMQQVIGSSPAVQVIIYKAKGALTGLSGLCGDANGQTHDDCHAMVGDVNKVEQASSLFLAAPFDFAGCATDAQVQWDWRNMGAVSDSNTCALKCKGFGAGIYYPEFYLKDMPNSEFSDCWCGNLKNSQTTAWARFALKPEELQSLPQTKGTCNIATCNEIKPALRSGDVCVFKEKEKVEPKPCAGRIKAAVERRCKADFGDDDDKVGPCIINLCQSDDLDLDEVERMDVEFEEQSTKDHDLMAKQWTKLSFSWGGNWR